ncbi:8-amino-7-oxononanoate synthase [Gillisia sp. Hel_I_86]|uniref:aminotransferase class I/II-fold pyridoxal phosphate-dependent enzyme n=1 Tax=Gillisia sp. Hel_I_86 TaxID=1249981 RepID=UPI00119BEF1D|nr:pyridoxal phosphate-dependent aminotransferase family protein [Gillisia sp. Hel_I_86]TVZ26480.1 8-amino-7-oxononanoate synthase [Gillisia sp. Hel_I_86]
MHKFPLKLEKRLENRKQQNAFRELGDDNNLIDFASNDYLGFAGNSELFFKSQQILEEQDMLLNGATGSRLLSGNHKLFPLAEKLIADIHNAEGALIFNSGYDANIGFFSAIPQKGDFIFYDELVHASIRDGIKMSNAKGYKFKHNDLEDLQKKLNLFTLEANSEMYIVTESVFSMDGDSPDLTALANFAEEGNYHLVVDEAHAIGVYGEKGKGLVQELELEKKVFARIVTFGKALGIHGAVILGSELLIQYLVNFCRSFIYTTALAPHSVASIFTAYQFMENMEFSENSILIELHENIQFFNAEVNRLDLKKSFIPSDSAIHCCIVSGNSEVKEIANKIQKKGFNVKPILSPTVPKGAERLRFCLHSFNSKEEIKSLLELLATFIK